jgi:branched-chain amino acid transport system substrate-binding protein
VKADIIRKPAVEVFVALHEETASTDLHPRELIALSRGFLRAGLESARFLWNDGRGWFTVTLERRHVASGGVRGLLMYREMLPPAGITTREIDVLTLVALGLTNGEIAARLGTSIRTVATQIERLLVKLHQGGRGGLAALAVDWGLLRLPIPGGVTGLTGLRLIDIERARLEPTAVSHPRPNFSFLDRSPFRLGTIAGAIGGSTAHAQEVERGASLAVHQLNAGGGVAGRRIVHDIVRADMYGADSVRQAFVDLIGRGVDAITTSFASASYPEMFELVADYGCPYLHTDTYEHSVELVRRSPVRFRSVFQTCPSETHYAEGFIDFINQLAARGLWTPRTRRIVSIVVEPDEHDRHQHALPVHAVNAGWDVCDSLICGPEDQDWTRALQRIQQSDADVVAVTHWNAAAIAPLQRAIADLGLPCLVFYVYGPSTPDFVASLGPSANGVVWSTVTGRYDDEIGRRFHREFTSMFGAEPGWSSASAAYDQVKLLAAAWAAVGTADFDTVSHYLRATPQRGVNGVYYFGEPGQSALSYPYATPDPSLGQAQMVYQIQRGRPKALWPATHGDLNAFALPSWVKSAGPPNG